MKIKPMLSFFICLAFIVFKGNESLVGQDNKEMVSLIKPTGESIGRTPIMEMIPDTSGAYTAVKDIIAHSCVKEIMELYSISQRYLKNLGITDHIEPAFLALTENQGGYAKKGFYLVEKSGDTLDYTSTHYVDIMLERLLSDHTGLMSFTQLYPHELAHVIYSLVSHNDNADPDSRNVDMHYFPVITDYSTAFNEGFAIHFENISRLFESNQTIIEGIASDVEKVKEFSKVRISGFLNDIKYPLRLGLYKSSVILWFQKYEDYRRYVHALDGSIKFINFSPSSGSLEDQLTIRNMGLLYGNRNRNLAQACATEGVVASFFTRLIQSELKDHYYGEEFYRLFLNDTTLEGFVPEQLFKPLQNQFIKYFIVLHDHVSKFNSSTVPLLDFANAYLEHFPDEAEVFNQIFLETTGHRITSEKPRQIWMMIPDHEHRMLAIDPFGAATIQVYTFDLNAAEIIDLMTIKGLTYEDAAAIVHFRDSSGLFTDVQEIQHIRDLSDRGNELVLSSAFDRDYFNSLPEPSLSFKEIKSAPLKSYLYKISFYLLLFLVILNFLLIMSKGNSILKILWINIKYALLWMLLSAIAAGLVLFIASPLTWMIPSLLVLYSVALLIYWRKPVLYRNLFMITIMGSIILLSLV